MINVSKEYKKTILLSRTFHAKADIQLKDGTILNIDDQHILQNSLKFEDGTSGSGSFDIGSAIINQCKLTIVNFDETYSKYDYEGAVIVPYIGLQLSQAIEWIKKGIYTVEEAVTTGGVINLTCLDNMTKFERPYEEVDTGYPATLGTILRDVCSYCNVVLNTATFDNMDYIVQQRPEDKALSCREMVSYSAQIAGCYARCNTNGALELKWYDFDLLEEEDNIDGGIYDNAADANYETGNNVDCGNFTDYNSEDNYSGGMLEDVEKYHHIYRLNSHTIHTDDVIITGIKVTADTDSETKEYFLYGNEGYILTVEKNPLIQTGKAEIVASFLGKKIVGIRFRPLTISALSDPSIEAGDIAKVTDQKQNTYQTVITNLSFAMGGYETFTCDAKSAQRNSVERYSEATKAIVEAKKETQKQLGAYELAVQYLTSLITQGFGIFITTEKLDDGSAIYYMHDKQALNESKNIWKMTADAFAVSSDGGQTWNAGIDADGNAVVNVLTAIGINAEWITTGTLSAIEINNGNGTFRVDKNGYLYATTGEIAGFELTTQEDTDSDGNTINRSVLAGGILTASNNGEGMYINLDKSIISFHSGSITWGASYAMYGENTSGSRTILNDNGINYRYRRGGREGDAFHEYGITFEGDEGDYTSHQTVYTNHSHLFSFGSYTKRPLGGSEEGMDYSVGDIIFEPISSTYNSGGGSATVTYGSGSRIRPVNTYAAGSSGTGGTQACYLGSTSYRWAGIYGVIGNFSSTLTCASLSQTSDKRLKTDIEDVNNLLIEAIKKIKPKQYRIANDDKIHIGIIAQEVIEAFDCVGLNAFDYGIVTEGEDGYYSVNYTEYNLLKQMETDKKLAALEKED